GGDLALLAHLAAPAGGEADIGVADIGSDLLVAQYRHRDHPVVAQQPDAAHTDRRAAGEYPDIRDREADRLAIAAGEQDIVGVGASGDRNQPVIGVLAFKLHRDLAVRHDVAEIGERVAPDIAVGRSEHGGEVGPALL